MLRDLTALTPETEAKVRQLLIRAEGMGLSPVVTSTYRTCAEQDAIYAQGRESPGDVATWVSGCGSWHTWGRAADILLEGAPADAYARLGELWESWGGRWGGHFDDPGHFEWHPGLEIRDLCGGPGSCQGPPWPDDRGLLGRPAVQGGLLLAVGGVLVARRLLGRPWPFQGLRRRG